MRGWKLGSLFSTIVKWFVGTGDLTASCDFQSADAASFVGFNPVRKDFQRIQHRVRTRNSSMAMQFFAFMILLGTAFTAEAGGDFCSDYPNGVVDGSLPGTFPLPSAFGIDRDCTIINFPLGNPLSPSGWWPTVNFYTPDKNTAYLIVFDNVYFNGNMACSNIPHKLWAVNSTGFKSSCQDIMIPAEMIDKQSPAATAAIGVPFTYTLTMPSMNYPAGNPSDNTLGNVIVTDDLTATGTIRVGPDGIPQSTGAELTYLGHTAYIKGGATLTEGTHYTFSNGGDDKHLSFNFGTIPAGTQIVVELTVVLDDIPTNVANATFINTAKWTFSRSIDLDENGIIEWAEDTNGDGIYDNGDDADGDGKFENEFFDPLPGEPGVAALMTIAEPDLVVSKSSSTAAMNLGTTATYTVSVQNVGGYTAWETSILDTLPLGMCDYFSASGTGGVVLGIYDAAGTTLLRPLAETTDYTLTWVGAPACTLTLDLKSAKTAIAPTEQLKVTYPGQLDADVADGSTHTNIAVAQQWYNADSSIAGRKLSGPNTSTDGSETYADTETITATLSGYFLKKSVTNTTTGESPALSASPGDILRYTLLLENFNIPSLTGATITDDLGALNDNNYIVPGSLSIVPLSNTFPVAPVLETGTNSAGKITLDGFDLATNTSYQIEFDVTVGADASGNVVQNQASITGYDTGSAVTLNGVSDDPFVNGPIKLGTGGDITEVAVLTGGALQKQNDQLTATIGEQFTYTVKVPAVPVGVPLYDVEITDDLTATGVGLKFVHAEVTAASSWQGTVTNSGTGASDTNLVLKNDITGIDIPANGYAEIKVTVELLNTTNSNAADLFHNQAAYSYDRTNGGGLRITPTSDPATDTTADMTVVEPLLDSATKTWSYVGGKASIEPAEVGDIIEYTISVTNNGSSMAYDTNIVDLLPSTVQLNTTSATATIGGSTVGAFVANPAPLGGGAVAWGRDNGDGSLDVPVGSTLVLTYQVTVLSVGLPIDNSAYVDWTSVDDNHPDRERTGAGCPTVDTLNDYCVVPLPVSITTTDTNTITKSVLDDSYTADSSLPPVVRVGDTVTYQLTVKLHEGITDNVVVKDVLPQGMQLTGSPTVTNSTGAINYTLTTTPTPMDAGVSGTLQWNFGPIDNQSGTTNPDGTDLLDEIRIEYTAVVVTNLAPTGVAHVAAITDPNSTNNATLSYTGGDPTSTDPLVYNRLNASQTVDIHQPIMSAISKGAEVVSGPAFAGGDGLADTTAYQVDVANNTLKFRLQTCNATGLAPAYNLVIKDQLPSELALTTLAGPVVKIGPDLASAVDATPVTDYVYTAPVDPGRLMNVAFTDARPINPTECVFVEYDIGFAGNIAPNTPWNNTATVQNYWSLPASSGREYIPADIATVYMTNTATLADPIKAIALPVAPTTTVTIGEEVRYTITIPATNATLTNVVVTDTLDPALVYIDATESAGLSLDDSATSGQNVSITIASIPAGQDAVITLRAQVVDNTAITTAGYTFENKAAYTYGGTTLESPLTSALTIVEPALVPTKTVSPTTPPTGGDILTYTIKLPAQTAANSSQAFDLTVIDTLGDGLSYETGSAQINGMPVSAPLPEPTLGTVGTQQTLTWAGLDIPYNTEVTITYDVKVLDSVVPNQTLSNSAFIEWTSLDTAVTGERTYSATVGTSLITADTASLTKVVFADSYTDATSVPPSTATDGIVRIGDTVDYQLTLNLQEGTTQNVSVTDQLPAGLEYDSLVSVVAGTGITYSTDPVTVTTDASNKTTFALGNVVHTQDADTDDAIVITYRVRVLKDTLAHQATTTPISNSATLFYTGAQAGNTSLQDSADITVLQPVVGSLTKTDRNGLISPLTVVDLANTDMAFRLHACNSGAAPAYSMAINDVLATQFDETTISNMVVSIGGSPTGNYVYGYTAATRTMAFAVNDPVYPNQCVDIDFDIGFRTDIGANQYWENSFTVSEYWSLQQPDSFAQQYSPVPLPAPFAMTNNATATPPTKELLTSPAEATIGEEVIYRITVPGTASTAGTLYDVKVTDNLDPNLQFVSATVTGLTGATVTDGSTDSQMYIEIDQIPLGERAVIELHARVRNELSAQQSVDINNTASYTYADTVGGTQNPPLSSSQLVTVNIVEPHIPTIVKIADKTTATAGETVRYSVTLTAAGGADSSDVFDVSLTDTLDAGLAYAGNPTVSVGTGVSADNTIGAPDITGDGSTTAPQTLVWSLNGTVPADIDIAEGTSITISYDVRVLDNVLANQTLANSVVAQWTGRDGVHTTATDYERDGSDGIGLLNDYVTAAATATITTPDTNTIAKERTSDTYAGGTVPENVRIGDLVEYTLTLSVQEGTLDNLVLADTLPQGLEFAGIVSINGNTGPTYTAVAPFSHADITAGNVTTSGTAAIGATTVTWNLGSVTNALNDGVNNEFVIVYRARVLNNVFAHTDLNIPLNNTVDMSYDTATGRVTKSDLDTVITALQPQLTVSKTVTAAGGDTVVDAGEVVTYTVDIQNNGTAPAYDVMLRDIIPDGMRAGGVTMVSTYLDTTALAALAPAYNLANGEANWNFDDGTTPSAYTIPAGSTLHVTYSVTVDSNVGAGLTLTNLAQATNYYSLNNDDASPTSSATYREEYSSNTASASVTTPAAGVLSKSTTQPSAGIGEEFTYNITVPSLANPATTALHDVRIYDNLAVGGADLEFVRADVLPGSDWTGTLVGSVDAAGIVEIRNVDAGGIEIPAGGHLQVAVTVRLLNTATNNTAGLTFTNRAWYTYNNGITTLGSDPTTGATSGSMTVAHPALTMTKAGPSPATMRVGTPATFTLDVQNTGTSDAWNVTVTDWLPNPNPGGMCDAGVSGVTATIYQADGTTTVQALVAGTHYNTSFTVSGTDPRCEFVLTTNGVAIAPTERLIVTYSVALDTDNIDGSTLTNIAGATQWFSADPAAGVYNTYTAALSDGTVGTVDHEDAYSVTVQGAVLTSQKTVENLTTGLSGANARPGDRLRYTIAIQNTTDIPLNNFSLVDELDRLNATPMFQTGSIANVNVPAGATFAIAGNTLNVDGLNIPANGNLSVSFEAVLVPVITSGTVVFNQGELTLGGTVFNMTDDPAIANAQDPTETLISSAPQFQIYKTSADITGDPNVLVAGDTLRYTITVKNIGTEDAVNVSLRDAIPVFTTYVANSTTLNGVAVADNTGASPLQSGMLINAPENTTPGYLRADASATTSNVATITFDVVTNLDVLDGTVITNQAFVNGSGAGSGPFVERVSDDNLVNGADDPAVIGDEDPTRDIVGNLPWLDATKTVTLLTDLNTNGAVDSGDTLHYTITVNNFGAIPATGVTLTDTIPTGTSYVAGTTRMNGVLVADPAANVSALESGMPINPAGSASGTVPAGASVEVTFDVQVASTVNPGDPIINQGYVSSTELPTEPTDADGNDANEDQPTIVYVGSAQQVSIVKSVSVVGGGAALPGGQLDYQVRVTNTGAATATNVVITDNLTALSGLATYVTDSATLNGVSNPSAVTYTAATQTLTANVGDLAVGESATLSFRVQIASGLADGTIIINNAQVDWNTPTLTATASARSDIGSIPGSAILGGNVWHDANFSNVYDPTELYLAGWNVALYRNNAQIGSVTTDANGHYQFSGLATTVTAADQYELRFTAPGAGATTAKLGLADSAFTNEPQLIRNIDAVSGSNIQTLNLPIDPNGVVYDSVLRTPIAGATLTLLHGGTAVASSCFDDPAQQNQVTLASGFYKFDLNYSDSSCPLGGDYVISVTPPATGYVAGPSRIIPPVSNDPAFDATSTPYSVASCTADALVAPADYCEAQPSEYAPPLSVAARTQGTNHYLYLTLSNPAPMDSQLFNNHIAIDPTLDEAITITKTAGLVNVSRGQLVPYTITVNNTMTVALQDMSIVDTFPAGFKYVKGSSRVDGQKVEPVTTNRTLSWNNLPFDVDAQHKIEMVFIVGSGVSEGEYVNRAQVINTFTGDAASGEANATVRVVPDPTFDCTDVIGKVFDDKNLNGHQDEGEHGLPGARVVSARGLIVTSDEYGRFHITCAVVPNESRGSNFILKLDDRSLPSGYRVTSENPRVQRVTRGKMMKFNFGATIHHVVRLDVADGVFEPNSATMRDQWRPRIGLLLEELKKSPSVLRLSYLADVEDQGLVRDRIAALKKMIGTQWDEANCCYKLTIESEVYWRRGAPPERSGVID